MKCKIGRYPEGITLNPMEFVLNKFNKIMEFNTISKAKEFLNSKGIKRFNGIYFVRC